MWQILERTVTQARSASGRESQPGRVSRKKRRNSKRHACAQTHCHPLSFVRRRRCSIGHYNAIEQSHAFVTPPLAKTSHLLSDIRLWRIGRNLALMRTAGFVALVALALVGVFALGLFGLAHFENPSSHFETYDELKASGLIERG